MVQLLKQVEEEIQMDKDEMLLRQMANISNSVQGIEGQLEKKIDEVVKRQDKLEEVLIKNSEKSSEQHIVVREIIAEVKANVSSIQVEVIEHKKSDRIYGRDLHEKVDAKMKVIEQQVEQMNAHTLKQDELIEKINSHNVEQDLQINTEHTQNKTKYDTSHNLIIYIISGITVAIAIATYLFK